MKHAVVFPASALRGLESEKLKIGAWIRHRGGSGSTEVAAFRRERAAAGSAAAGISGRATTSQMMREIGYCKGVENYSRYFDGRQPGDAPFTLLDYFPKDFLIFIDESHVTVPQIRAMYNGDYARKRTLVDFGFRLPSAFDNRPLKFHEFEQKTNQLIYVSATPGPYELGQAGQVVEQIIRPTGLLDPVVEVRPTKGQIDDLLSEIRRAAEDKSRVLVTFRNSRSSCRASPSPNRRSASCCCWRRFPTPRVPMPPAARRCCTISARTIPRTTGGNCDNCRNPKPKVDARAALKMALEALRDIGDKFKADYLVNVLVGKTTALIKSYGHNKSKWFGAGAEHDARFWGAVLRQAFDAGPHRQEYRQRTG